MTDLQTLINSIPTAQDGAPITVDYHNNMLLALRSIAASLGVSVTTKPVVITLSAQMSPNEQLVGGNVVAVTPWVHETGIAKKPGGATAVTGWQQLPLPDGMIVQSIVITGNKTIPGASATGLGSWTVQYVRQPLVGAGATLKGITVDNAPVDSTNNYQAELDPPADIVDNSKFKYLLVAKIVGADPAATAEIHSFQVTCTQPNVSKLS